MMTNSLPEKVYAFTDENALFNAPCRVLVGVSGGADSMSLLHVLCRWPQEGLEVTAVHIHHGLRGEAADRDADFVREQCKVLQVPLQIVHTDVNAVADSLGCGVEEAGRRERYRIFEELRTKWQADWILTAHTADDQSETILMHILRGCGTDGLCGIPAKRGCICRPLLCCTRREIEEYCAANGVDYVTDESNYDTSYTRNRIRCEVLPLLRQVNPAADNALRRLSIHSGEDSRFLCSLALDALNQARLPEGGYAADLFVRQPLPIRRRMIYAVLEDLQIPSVEEKHLLAIEAGLLRGKGGVLLPTGVNLVISQGRLYEASSYADIEQKIGPINSFPYRFIWQEHTVELTLSTDAGNVHKMFLQSAIDCDRIQGDLYVRSRREGDILHPAGRGIGKTVKKLMNEWKIPANRRDSFPLLCDDCGVVLIPGYSCDERVRITDDTKHFLVWSTCTELG